MKFIFLFILFDVKIINSGVYKFCKDNTLKNNDIQNSLISSYNKIHELKCIALCNSEKDCQQVVFTSDSTCYLLNSIVSSANYASSTNSVIFNKQVEILLNAVRSGNYTTLTWTANMNRTFSRYIVKYTSDDWATTLTAPGLLLDFLYRFSINL